jgi:tetratricopeptide (TPR) repeat protein
MSRMTSETASRHIQSFQKSFGEAHLYFACHAALPIALTPDLLYLLWKNFQHDINGEQLNIPWIAVADLLLSGLCHEVGHELYEIDLPVRNILLNNLQKNQNFGKARINNISNFLLEYIKPQLSSTDQDTQDLAQTQRLTALAYLNPSQAARELALAFAKIDQKDTTELLRVASLVETLAEPIYEYTDLLYYSHAIINTIYGRLEDATHQFIEILEKENLFNLPSVSLSIPKQINLNLSTKNNFSHKYLPIIISLIVATTSAIDISVKSTIIKQDVPKEIFNKADELTFEDAYKLGHARYKERDYESAIQHFTTAIKREPNHARAYINRGNAYYNIKQYNAALSDYNKAIQINPSEIKAYIYRGNARLVIAEYSSDPDKNYKDAIEDFNNAIRLNSNEVDAFIRRGIVHAKIAKSNGESQKDYQKAIQDFNTALSINPSRAEAYFQRGVVRYQIGQYSSEFEQEYRRAIDDFNKALSINSQLSKVYLKRGMVRYELAQNGGKQSHQYNTQALSDLRQAAKISLEQKDMENYQQALNSICVVLGNKCDSSVK